MTVIFYNMYGKHAVFTWIKFHTQGVESFSATTLSGTVRFCTNSNLSQSELFWLHNLLKGKHCFVSVVWLFGVLTNYFELFGLRNPFETILNFF